VLLLLDGELPCPEAEEVGTHLQNCGECQVKMARLKKGIDTYVVYGLAALAAAVGTPPNGWKDFPTLLDRIAAQGECPEGPEAG